ncbi:MAG: TonB-dependent receptor [Candidatus Pseudobacter hemicellulosilyticus]|uniref:TonB-dependent receptor n=1 Tax=Candidatus Pseudobacter hemicellulosilyticus TaxID=3121375 RepID=A0AAJ5WRC4_9BACT|nr:MAG: TonB-dependent receptor [Pseudobacter sp.]
MKLTILLLTAALFTSHASGLAQNVTISGKDLTFKRIFTAIEKQTGYVFFGNRELFSSKKTVSLSVYNIELRALLDMILKDQPYEYAIEDRTVFISKKAVKYAPLVFANLLEEPEDAFIDVKGRVVSDKGEPVAAATILIKGTTTGTNTDEDGSFSLKGVDQNATLVISGVNIETFEVAVRNRRDLGTLEAKLKVTEEENVVVVGYGRQKKISLVGAQATVNIEEVKLPVANLSASLAGRIAGLVGVQRTGLPGSNAADIWIRGISTFSGSGNSATPLIIVDGVQGRDINAFDPEDIQSFTILKDASATAVYGAQGANGVILITTKKGKTGKPVLMFNYNQGVVAFTETPKLTNGEQYMRLRNEAQNATAGYAAEYSEKVIAATVAGTEPYVYPNVDWMDALFKSTAENRRFNFSARGGSTNTSYYTSLAYYDETSLLRTDNLAAYKADTRFRRYNFTSNVDMDWTKTTRFSLGLQGYITNTDYPGTNPQDAFDRVMQTNPILYPIMYPGNLVPAVNASADAQPNPYALITQTGYQNIFASQLYTNAQISQKLDFIVKGLTFHSMFSFDTWNSHTINRTRSRSTYMVDKVNPYLADSTLNLTVMSNGTDNLSYSRSNSGNRQIYTESGLNYTNSFGDHNVTGMLLYKQTSRIGAFADNLISSLPYRNQGIVGRATYSYDNRYFVEFNGSYDGAENFAPSKKFGFFPSLGVGWVLSNEKFWEPVKDVFSFFKLRYSNGVVGDGAGGNRRFGFMTLVTTGATGYQFYTGSNTYKAGVAISDYGVPITWAESHKQNLGWEFRILDDYLSVTLDYFKEHRTGVFLQRGSLPLYIGLQTQPWGNLGVIDNRGFEGTVELAPLKWGNTSWTFRGTFSYNKDKVIENDYPIQLYPYLERRGRNYLGTYGYVAEGLFQTQSEIETHADQTGLGSPRVGDIKYKDLNGDGVINTYDQTKIGNGDVPNWTYGAGFNVTWKNWYFGAFFQGISGADRQLSGDGIIPFNNSTGAERSNLFAIAEDRWTEENPKENPFYPRLAYGNAGNKNNAQTSTWWQKDIDFIRLKTLDFGYYIPTKGFVKTIGVKNARIYFQGVNLLYWSPFKLWDPELNTSNGTSYPNTKTFSFGIQANL